MNTTHWGEIPKENNDYVPDVMPDIERSMDKFCLAEFEDDDVPVRNEKIVLPPIDPLILYAISLHKYTNDMTEMIRVAELATEVNLIPPEDAAPPMPEMPQIDIKHQRNSLNFITKELTPFSQGQEVEMPELSETVVKQILHKSVVTMFAHIGFETTHQSVLDVLTDVLETFFKKFTLNLKAAVEDEENHGTTFPHVIERVLTETGLGGVKGLNDYYQCRVVKYINVLQKRCKELNDYYARLLIPSTDSSGENSNKVRVKIKVEQDDDVMEIENPELHFTTIDGDCSTLESGYQLLNSLEAVTNLQSLGDSEEDMVASTSGVSGPSESDITHIPFSKRKRFK
ncbi:uncharacterized protein LOC109600261 [Aethina tumida]|uniref:uncharacterized protein LOC109600261 n=1 Tax=Aethina tumida TaxID=116153 RepID=UPI002148E7C3|nr:uncharacterized protein LOC109600261 [Aethina tumida]